MEDSLIVDLYFERNEQAIAETQNKYGRLCTKIAAVSSSATRTQRRR